MATQSIIGSRAWDGDNVVKARGEAKFTKDLELPGMLWGRILRSPFAHAKILNLDFSKARKVPGVMAIITPADLPQAKYGICVADEALLNDGRVRYVGDEVAAVAAVDEEAAEEALELIEVEYEPLPTVFETEKAMEQGAPLIHLGKERNVTWHFHLERGDVEKGFSDSHVVREERFETGTVHQGYMEPMACLCQFDASGRLTVFASTQAPFELRGWLAKALGMEVSRIRVIQPYVGGAFGGKHTAKAAVIGALLARASGRPVKVVNSREEEFLAGRPRTAAVVSIKMGAAKDGRLLAQQCLAIMDNGAYSDFTPWIPEEAVPRKDNLYRFENVRNEAFVVYTNKVPTGCYRGFGNPQVSFASEQMMDIMAERLGFDAVDFRLINAVRPGDVTVHGFVLRSCGLDECIKRARELARWEEKKAKRIKGGKKKRGLGMACLVFISGFWTKFGDGTVRARIEVGENGRALVLAGESDVGQGSNMVFRQIAAQELGFSLEEVDTLKGVDTDFAPASVGTFADRVTHMAGNAVKLAAAAARERLLQEASSLFGLGGSDLEIRDGVIFSDQGKISVRLPELMIKLKETREKLPIVGHGEYLPDCEPVESWTKFGNYSSAYPFGCQVAEVEVDTETGMVTVLNFYSSHDVGRVVNPLGAEGQVEGSVAQGLGYATREWYAWPKRNQGQCLNPDLLNYRILTALDMPVVFPIFVETDDPVGPYGAKGLAEGGMVPTAAAIANAIYNAVGVRVKKLPILPEQILGQLKTAKRKS